jgi:hypothetical protein
VGKHIRPYIPASSLWLAIRRRSPVPWIHLEFDIPRLESAADEDVGRIEISPFGLHCPTLDKGLSFAGILEGRYGQRRPCASRDAADFASAQPAMGVTRFRRNTSERETHCTKCSRGLRIAGLMGLRTVRTASPSKEQAAERLASLCGFVRTRAATFKNGQSSPSRMVPNRCFDGRYRVFGKRWRKKWRAGLVAGVGRAWHMASFEGSRNTPPARPPEFDTN